MISSFAGSGEKSVWSMCRICEALGCWGVGASGSIIMMRRGPGREGSRRKRGSGAALSRETSWPAVVVSMETSGYSRVSSALGVKEATTAEGQFAGRDWARRRGREEAVTRSVREKCIVM